MRRGEVWWVTTDPDWPVVLLGDGPGETAAIQIVAPATPEQKRGYVIMTPEQAVQAVQVDRPDQAKRTEHGERAARTGDLAGIEVPFGSAEGLDRPGVVRVALPRDGHIFCTWRLTVDAGQLVERAGRLSPAKQQQLDLALKLAGEV